MEKSSCPMEKTYRPYDPDQLFRLPPALQDWVPEGHLVHFLSDVVDALDLNPLLMLYEREARGYPPYHPRMMTKLLRYAYAVGIPSSRKIAQRCEEDLAFRVLTANQTPDFRHHQRLSAAPSGGVDGPVRAGAAGLSACRPGEVRRRGPGWHKGPRAGLQA